MAAPKHPWPPVLIALPPHLFADAAARAALGEHIGQAPRMALRRPDAIALIDRGGIATVLGLANARSIWQVALRPIGEGTPVSVRFDAAKPE